MSTPRRRDGEGTLPKQRAATAHAVRVLYRAPVVRYVPAPECVSDDGEIPAGFTVCTWNDGTGVPFVGSVPDADGVAQTIDYSWDGVSPVMVGVES